MRCFPKPRPRCAPGTAILAIDRHWKSGRKRKTMKPRRVSWSSGGQFRGSSGTGLASKVSRQPLFLDTPVVRQFSWKTSVERTATWLSSAFRRGSLLASSPVGEMLASTSSASRRFLARAASAAAPDTAARAAAASAAAAFSAAAAASTVACFSASCASSAASCFSPSISRSMTGLEDSFAAMSGFIELSPESMRSCNASISRSFLRRVRMRFSVAVSGFSFSTYSRTGAASTTATALLELCFFEFVRDRGG
mmetsp:Transcript_65680/g.118342  ORF Transcript_65680/g.118342 Transcript_65680/m.118342 type:complete len:252 (+) Transcript_65680:188-943(+)